MKSKLIIKVNSETEQKPLRFSSKTKKALMDVTIELDEIRNILQYRNPYNRPITESNVRKLLLDMVENRWEPNNANPIRFDYNDNLIDGQHRLLAALNAEKPLTTDVLTGLSPETILYIDIGMGRRPAVNPVLLQGMKTNTVLTKADFKLKQKQLSVARLWAICGHGIPVPSALKMEEIYINNSAAIDFAMAAEYGSRPGYASALALFYTKDPVAAENFREEVAKATLPPTQYTPTTLLADYLSKPSIGGSQTKYDHWVAVNAMHFSKTLKRVPPCVPAEWLKPREWEF